MLLLVLSTRLKSAQLALKSLHLLPNNASAARFAYNLSEAVSYIVFERSKCLSLHHRRILMVQMAVKSLREPELSPLLLCCIRY